MGFKLKAEQIRLFILYEFCKFVPRFIRNDDLCFTRDTFVSPIDPEQSAQGACPDRSHTQGLIGRHHHHAHKDDFGIHVACRFHGMKTRSIVNKGDENRVDRHILGMFFHHDFLSWMGITTRA